MKSISELTEVEVFKLKLARSELLKAAFQMVSKPSDGTENQLFFTARAFDKACREIGFDEYWNEIGPTSDMLEVIGGMIIH